MESRLLLPEELSEVGLTLTWMVSNGGVESSPRRQSGGVKDSIFTTSTSPTPEAWVREGVQWGRKKKTRDVLRVRARTKALEFTNYQLSDILV